MGKSIICLGKGGLGKAFESHGVTCIGREDVDVNDVWRLNALFNELKPKYVLNCTGVVGTGKCDHDPETAYMVNVGGVSNINWICKKYATKLIHFSTFYLGDFNTYTRSKSMAEQIVDNSTVDACIIRLPWVFGKFTNNFILSAIQGKNVSIYDGEVGYLAYDEDIVDYVLNNIDCSGVVSLANKGQADRREVLEFIGCNFEVMARKTKMPVAYNPTHLMRPWKESMKEFINGIRSM